MQKFTNSTKSAGGVKNLKPETAGRDYAANGLRDEAVGVHTVEKQVVHDARGGSGVAEGDDFAGVHVFWLRCLVIIGWVEQFAVDCLDTMLV